MYNVLYSNYVPQLISVLECNKHNCIYITLCKIFYVITCFHRYEVFTGRVLLAALDHNFHLFRKTLEGRFKKLYSKRSGNWRAEAVKEPKSYDYWSVLLFDILRRRAEDESSMSRRVNVSPSHPQNIAATIAMRVAPPTEELVKAKVSRFSKP